MSSDTRSEIRDGMRIDWDVPIEMDDGLVVRADVYRPVAAGKYPVLLTYGPYGKWLAFQEAYDTAWERMAQTHPEVMAGSTNRYQNWEVVDPEKWVPDGYVCVRVDSRGCGRSPGYVELWSAREVALRNYARLEEFAPYVIEDGSDVDGELGTGKLGIGKLVEEACAALGWDNCTVKGDLVLRDGEWIIIELLRG